jgi:hypothetical protein
MRYLPERALGCAGLWLSLVTLWYILATAVVPHINSESVATVCGLQGLATFTLVPYLLALRWWRRRGSGSRIAPTEPPTGHTGQN